MIIHEIDENKFDEYVKEGIVLVDFFANWCGPCKMLAPELEELSKNNDIKIIKIDVDKYRNLSISKKIMTIPTLILYKNGKLIESKIGYMPKDAITTWIETSN